MEFFSISAFMVPFYGVEAVDVFSSLLLLLSTSPYVRQFTQIDTLSLPKPEFKFLGFNIKLYRGLGVLYVLWIPSNRI